MTWLRVWSLKRGIIDPPEPISQQDAEECESLPARELAAVEVQAELRQLSEWMEV